MSLRRAGALLVAAWVALVSNAATVRANPVDAFGFGARPMAMAGAGTAIARGVAAGYYNPAALAADSRHRVDFGYVFVQPRLRINDGDAGVDPTRGVQSGLSLVGDAAGRRLAFSLSLFMPDRMLTRTRSLRQSQPRFVLYDNRPQRFVMGASLALDLVRDLLYAGAGVTFMSHTRGVLDIAGTLDLFDAEQAVLLGAIDEDLVSVRYPTVGLLLTPTPDLRVGLTYRAEFVLQLELDVRITGDVMANGGTMLEDASFLLRSKNRNHFTPRQLALGVAWTTGAWTLVADGTWAQWSRFPAPASIVDIELDLEPLTAEIPPIERPHAPDFRDIVIGRLAAEWSALTGPALSMDVRMGYAFEPSPAPDQPGLTNYLDGDKHHLTCGLGLTFALIRSVLPLPTELDLSAQLIAMPDRTYRKADPADPVGDMVSGGYFWGVSAMSRLRF